jgi:hypothetical protein
VGLDLSTTHQVGLDLSTTHQVGLDLSTTHQVGRPGEPVGRRPASTW